MKLGTAADGLGMLALCWTLFSLFGVFDFADERRWQAPLSVNTMPDWVIWGLHALFIACAVRLSRPVWRPEMPSGRPNEEGVWPPPPRRRP